MDRKDSLTILEENDWGEANFPSEVVYRAHSLRNIPLNELTPDDLRFLIGQKISLMYLIPLALEILENNPMLESLYYEGDLLNAVHDTPSNFWEEYPELHFKFIKILERINISSNS